jgi:hypothetical protein
MTTSPVAGSPAIVEAPQVRADSLGYRRFLVPGLIALYLNTCVLAWAWLLLDVSTGTFNTLRWLGLQVPTSSDYLTLLKLVFYAAAGGGIGGLVYGMQSLWKHTTRGRFALVYAGDYLFRQFGSAVLAVVIFSLIRGGILTALGAEPSSGTTNVASTFSAFAIGFLSGFGSYQVMNKLDDMIKQAFGRPTGEDRPADAPPKPSVSP